uniref:TIR domain-containing protein n=1 Tax=Strigamia maritima TaxID=126957 RepID=T1IUI7_STRMM
MEMSMIYLLPLLVISPTTAYHSCIDICCRHDGITHCFLNGTGFEALSNVSTEVTKLSVIRNNVKILEEPYFKNFIHLQDLNLDWNMMKIVNHSAFEGLIHLENISLAYNEIETIEDNVFRYCAKLKNIDFSYNEIFELNGVTRALSQLSISKLILSNLQSVTRISKSDFLSLASSQLKELDLSMNNIEEIEKGSFGVLTKLECLSLKGNKVNEDDVNNAFCNISFTLDYLDLSHMKLKDDSFASLEFLSSTRIRELNLGSNFFTRLAHFPYMPFLEKLVLKDGQIRSVYTRVVHFKLPNLRELDLSNNLIRYIDVSFPVIPIDVFVPKPTNLAYLHLHHNKLSCKSIHEYLSNMTKLTYLDLSHNCLCDISQIIADLSPEITHLNVSSNGIEPWNKPLNLMKLETLLIDDNSLHVITNAMMQDFKHLKTLDVSKNPLNCDTCIVTGEFAELLNRTDITIKHLDEVTCDKPETFYRTKVIHATNAGYCNRETKHFTEVLITISGFLVFLGVNVYYFRWYILYYWWHHFAEKYQKMGHKYCSLYNVFTIHSPDATDWIESDMIPNLKNLEAGRSVAFVEGLPAGKDFIEELTTAIENSGKIVFLLDNEFLENDWCKWELSYAHFCIIDSRIRNRMIFIVLEDLNEKKMSKKLKFFIKTRYCLKWRQHRRCPQVFWAKLKYYLEKKEKLLKEKNPVNLIV